VPEGAEDCSTFSTSPCPNGAETCTTTKPEPQQADEGSDGQPVDDPNAPPPPSDGSAPTVIARPFAPAPCQPATIGRGAANPTVSLSVGCGKSAPAVTQVQLAG
jgi:hypothetical protein